MGYSLEFTIERKFQVPENAPPKLVEDIKVYSAFVEMQAKMSGASAWYQKLS